MEVTLINASEYNKAITLLWFGVRPTLLYFLLLITYVIPGKLLKLAEYHFIYKMGIVLPSSKGAIKIKLNDDVIL